MKRLLLTLLVTLSFTGFLRADASLDAIAAKLTPKYHLFGQKVSPKDLPGHVVVIWNLTELVPGDVKDDDQRNRWQENRRERNEEGEEIESPADQFRKKVAALRKADRKSQVLLIIGVVSPANTTEGLKSQREEIRQLRPAFPVYAIATDSAIYDAQGNCKITTKNIADIIEGDRLTNALAETPEYVPGRIIHFKTEASESTSKRFVAGQNLESMYSRLQTTAGGRDTRATDAQRMIEAIDAYIEQECAAIEQDLEQRPSRAIGRITTFCATFPTRGMKYNRILNLLRGSREIKTCLAVNAFLNAANSGDIGTGDLGRKADGFVKALNQLTRSKNQSIAAEAAALLPLVTPYTSAELQAARKEQQARDRELKEDQDKRQEENRRNRSGRRSNGEEEPSIKYDTDVYTYLTTRAPGGSYEIFKEDLAKQKHATANYDAIKTAYSKYLKGSGEKTEAAKSLIAAIDILHSAYHEKLKDIVKNPLNVLLTEHECAFISETVIIELDYEELLTTHFPSLANTPEGRTALKYYRNSEVKNFADAVRPLVLLVDSGKKQLAALKQLKKLRAGAKSHLGKLCKAQVESMGYTDEAFDSQVEACQEKIKEEKQREKEFEEQQKEARKRWR